MAGAQVTVLTAAKHSFDAPLDLHLPELSGVQVIEVPYGGTRLSLFGRVTKNQWILTYLKKFKAFLRTKRVGTGDPRSMWLTAAKPHVEKLAKENDIIISTYGPDSSHLIAYYGKRENPDLKWVADYRDLWSENPSNMWSDNVKASVRSMEKATVGDYADVVTAVSEDMLSKLGEFCKGKLLQVPNGFDLEDWELECVVSSVRSGRYRPLRIVHTGTVYSGQRDPTSLLEVLAEMSEKKLLGEGDVLLEFYGTRVEPIKELMKNPRFKPFLRTPGHLPREEAIRVQREADLLLLLESSTPDARGVLTGKVFEYISAGRPIICIGSRPDFEVGLLLHRTGTGVVASSDEVADAINQLLSGRSSPMWFAPRLDEIRLYSRKGQSLLLLAAITESGK
jgi:glycosyltransferase involved in cell wall biosynthesis